MRLGLETAIALLRAADSPVMPDVPGRAGKFLKGDSLRNIRMTIDLLESEVDQIERERALLRN